MPFSHLVWKGMSTGNQSHSGWVKGHPWVPEHRAEEHAGQPPALTGVRRELRGLNFFTQVGMIRQ